ncbi:MAG: Flp family type IVb pilin [Atopobium sp.]|uniref:Flp family type IVb pilin n=1 Tax=Atopobium sp. TaxID=1872650 RepID=UPI002A74A4E1|nr:Flp family type IVb pilin [Atopobium sp.]MDY2789041.1 Flp family type IVb pilin [Atopobium sp.]MDY4522278.1 Flp family type IVb pilin [Atopobium sp.]
MDNALMWFKEEESGQGLVEYGLIIALIAVVCIVALTTLGDGIRKKFVEVNDKLTPKPGP